LDSYSASATENKCRMVAEPAQLNRTLLLSGPSNGSNIARTLAKLSLHFYLDLPIKVSNALQNIGLHALAEQFLWRVHCAAPYDSALGEYLAQLRYENHQRKYPVGTVERGRFIMQVLLNSYPAPGVVTAYFSNLAQVMQQRERRASPGQIVLGFGAGRCGSTTLAALLHSIEGAVSTHENPPLIFWEPTSRQVQFHLDRFDMFSRHFPIVADCSHWWINVVDTVFAAFPSSKAIGLYRDTDACVRSWVRVTHADTNHFVPPHNRIWLTDRWDRLYPHYDMPDGARRNPRQAKEQLIRRYVVEYNERLHALAARLSDRMLLLRTEELDLAATRRRISEFVGLPVGLSEMRLNVRRQTDSPSADDHYF
jgi:hypothetical protein